MGKRGPKAKSNKTKALEGNPSNRKLVDGIDHEDVSLGSLRMPLRLTKDEKIIWNEIVGAFPSWYFTAADKHTLVAYCRVAHRLEKAEKNLQNSSLIKKRANDSPCQNPNVKIAADALAQMLRLRTELGVSREKRGGLARKPNEAPPQSEPSSGTGGEEQEEFESLIPPDVNAP